MTWLFSKAMMAAYGNSPSSLAPAAASSVATFSDGEPSAQLNVMPTPHKFWRNDKTMDASRLFQFGLTLRLLTDDLGEAVLTSYLEAFPARISASQEKAQVLRGGQDQDSGAIKHGSFAKWNQHSRGWRTVQPSLFGDLNLSLETWPKWGLMQDGVCLEVDPLAPRMSACESGFWHPTPTARDWKGASNGQKQDYSRWTTWLHHNVSHDQYTTYPHPSCSEKVMGWPIGWTELAPLEMGKFQQWQQQHGRFSADEKN